MPTAANAGFYCYPSTSWPGTDIDFYASGYDPLGQGFFRFDWVTSRR